MERRCHAQSKSHSPASSVTVMVAPRTWRGTPGVSEVLKLVVPRQKSRGAASSIFLVHSALSWLQGKRSHLNFVFAYM